MSGRGPTLLTVVRVSVGLALLLPLVIFALGYVWQSRGVDGLPAALAVAVLEGILASVEAAAADPARAALSALLMWVLGRIAFSRR